MSGGTAAVGVVVKEGAGIVVGANSGVDAEGAALDGGFEVETTGRRLFLEERGGDPVVQAARASAPTTRQTVITAVQREDRR